MVNSLENIDKSKVSADRIEGLDAKIQEELSTAVTGAASTIITSDLTANRAVTSNANGKVAISSTTSTELGYVHGVTSAIQTQLNAKAADNAVVKLTGNQTITGIKTIQDFSLVVKNTETDDEASSITSSKEYGMLIQDKNGSRIGNFYGGQLSDGKLRTYMCACRPVNGSVVYKFAEIKQSTDGTGHFNISCDTTQAPTPATSDNSTKIATTAFVKNQGYIGSANLATVHVVTQTYVNGTSWYRIYDDGWVEQGGVLPKTTSSVSISFMKPFSNKNFSMQFSPICPTNISSSRYQREVCINSFTVSNFSATTYDSSAFWYACGMGA